MQALSVNLMLFVRELGGNTRGESEETLKKGKGGRITTEVTPGSYRATVGFSTEKLAVIFGRIRVSLVAVAIRKLDALASSSRFCHGNATFA